MSSIHIDFAYIDDFESSSNRLIQALEGKLDDYAATEGSISVLPTSREYLGQCNYFLKKKKQMLQEKIQTLSNFKTKMVAFARDAEATDQRVAAYIQEQSDVFEDTTGIEIASGGVLASLSNKISDFWKDYVEPLVSVVIEGIKAVGDAILTFYEEHKYIMDVIGSTLLLTAAVLAVIATGGALLTVVAAFLAVGAAASMIGSVAALYSDMKGEHDAAERWSNFHGQQAFRSVGDQIDQAVGTNGFGDMSAMVHTGMSIGVAVYLCVGTVRSVSNIMEFAPKPSQVLSDYKKWGGITQGIGPSSPVPPVTPPGGSAPTNNIIYLKDYINNVTKLIAITASLKVGEEAANVMFDFGLTPKDKGVVSSPIVAIPEGYRRQNEQLLATGQTVTTSGWITGPTSSDDGEDGAAQAFR